jgi:hypothetical protein
MAARRHHPVEPTDRAAEPASRFCFRQLNTWFAFTSYGRATIETDEPGANDAAIPASAPPVRRLRGRLSRSVHTRFCGHFTHFSPSEPKSITLNEMKRDLLRTQAGLRMVQLAAGAADYQSAKARSRARIGSYTAFCKGPARLEPTSVRPVDVSIISRLFGRPLSAIRAVELIDTRRGERCRVR